MAQSGTAKYTAIPINDPDEAFVASDDETKRIDRQEEVETANRILFVLSGGLTITGTALMGIPDKVMPKNYSSEAMLWYSSLGWGVAQGIFALGKRGGARLTGCDHAEDRRTWGESITAFGKHVVNGVAFGALAATFGEGLKLVGVPCNIAIGTAYCLSTATVTVANIYAKQVSSAASRFATRCCFWWKSSPQSPATGNNLTDIEFWQQQKLR